MTDFIGLFGKSVAHERVGEPQLTLLWLMRLLCCPRACGRTAVLQTRCVLGQVLPTSVWENRYAESPLVHMIGVAHERVGEPITARTFNVLYACCPRACGRTVRLLRDGFARGVLPTSVWEEKQNCIFTSYYTYSMKRIYTALALTI